MDSHHLTLLADALAEQAAAIAEKPVTLVSVTFDRIAAAPAGAALHASIEITRATRTLVFSRGDLRDGAGSLVLSATAVHRI
ncbi:MAG: hypothetical protein NW200_12960 [Hyphomonadaceae bacterium]|nr:hypothetical protein [Hyphomonadaceae bacterium]